jgi:hypothetical protein
VSEVSELESTQTARQEYDDQIAGQRLYL